MPASAGDHAILDEGQGFQRHDGVGLQYGWDCDGDPNVDFNGGRRGLNRDNGLGINHFDRDGTCPGRVDWQVAVPNGVYTAVIDFGEPTDGAGNPATHGCEVEGAIVCPNNDECLYKNTVWITDGYFTITGYSHDTLGCHSISQVILISGAVAPPPEDLLFYFGTQLPPSAGSNAILDDGLGFAHHDDESVPGFRASMGLDYGWDCDHDSDVDFSSGRRDLTRDNGLGMNHFDRSGECSGRVDWQVAVPNGVYTVVVDFGMDDRWAKGCEVEGAKVCPAEDVPGVGCIFYNTVWVTDGFFTITGYSHDSLACHSVSMVKISSAAAAPPPENLEFYFGTEMPATASPIAILDDGLGFTHHAGHGSRNPTATFPSFKFNIDPADDRSGLRTWDCCVQLAEIALYDTTGTTIPGATATNPVGLDPLRPVPLDADGNIAVDYCDDTGAKTGLSPGQHPCGEMPYSAVDGNTNHADDVAANSNHKWLDFTMGDLVMTFRFPVTVASYDWRTANDAPGRDPTKWTLEGTHDGYTWNVLDDTYASNLFTPTDDRFTWQGPFHIKNGGGLSYGWDCDGNTAVDYSGGRRGLDRDGGLGINHFDRSGTCPAPSCTWDGSTPLTTECSWDGSSCQGGGADGGGVGCVPGTGQGRVNWQVAVPNGAYTAEVDFGEPTDGNGNPATHGCEVEQKIVCPNDGKCLFGNTVWVTDGYFTITGFSHNTLACHSVSMVKLSTFPDALGFTTAMSGNLAAGLARDACHWDPCREAQNSQDPTSLEESPAWACAAVPENPTLLNTGYGRSPHAEGGCRTCTGEDMPMNGVRRCGAASQSTMGWGSPNDPGKSHGEPGSAIDGDYDTSFGAGSCTHTDLTPAWWQVDLGQKVIVDRVNIWHRTDCCRDRLESAQIFVSLTPDFSAGEECAPLSNSTMEPETAQCNKISGNYITVYHDKKDDPTYVGYHEDSVISICEFEVWGEPAIAGESGGSVIMQSHVQNGLQLEQTVRSCESDTVSLTCAQGTIDVVEASYGRAHDESVCTHAATSDQSCHAIESTGIVKSFCQGKEACSIEATNGVFGDPCVGTYKYLTVNYQVNLVSL
jgi:hypothetical protein